MTLQKMSQGAGGLDAGMDGERDNIKADILTALARGREIQAKFV